MKQQSFTDMEYGGRRRVSRWEQFLDVMEEIIPWEDWIGLIEPHYFPVTRADGPLDEQYALAVHKVARLTRCNLFDLRAWFLRERDLGSLYCIDGMHPNGKGHQVIAQAVSADLPLLFAVYDSKQFAFTFCASRILS